MFCLCLIRRQNEDRDQPCTAFFLPNFFGFSLRIPPSQRGVPGIKLSGALQRPWDATPDKEPPVVGVGDSIAYHRQHNFPFKMYHGTLLFFTPLLKTLRVFFVDIWVSEFYSQILSSAQIRCSPVINLDASVCNLIIFFVI